MKAFLAWLFEPFRQKTLDEIRRARLKKWGVTAPESWTAAEVRRYHNCFLVTKRLWRDASEMECVDAIHDYCVIERFTDNLVFDRLQRDHAMFRNRYK